MALGGLSLVRAIKRFILRGEFKNNSSINYHHVLASQNMSKI